MSAGWRRVVEDLKSRRHIDAYSVATVSFLLAVLSLVPDIIPDPVRWAALLAGVGLLVWRVTLPAESRATFDELLSDRFAFDATPFADRLKNASEVWIFAPSGVNLLSAHNCELLRKEILSKPDGTLRVVVLNGRNQAAVRLATRQLDDSLDYPVQEFQTALQATVRQLEAMTSWNVPGHFNYRFLDYNPGFSLVCIEPTGKGGCIIVEFHGFHNEATSSRMHLEIGPRSSSKWFAYWMNQFNRIWDSASDANSGFMSGR
jgi:hypothetical protein